jgi:hypothetical protein
LPGSTLIARIGTPAHLATADGNLDMDLFMAVTAEFGDVVLGPPGRVPEEDSGGQGN